MGFKHKPQLVNRHRLMKSESGQSHIGLEAMLPCQILRKCTAFEGSDTRSLEVVDVKGEEKGFFCLLLALQYYFISFLWRVSFVLSFQALIVHISICICPKSSLKFKEALFCSMSKHDQVIFVYLFKIWRIELSNIYIVQRYQVPHGMVTVYDAS